MNNSTILEISPSLNEGFYFGKGKDYNLIYESQERRHNALHPFH